MGFKNKVIKVTYNISEMKQAGLFDYQQKKPQEQILHIDSDICFLQGNNNISHQKIEEIDEETLQECKLIAIKKYHNQQNYYIDPSQFQKNKEKDKQKQLDQAYLVIRKINGGYNLKLRDIVKVGKVELKLVEFKSEHGKVQKIDAIEEGEMHPKANQDKILENVNEEDMVCKYCFVNKDEMTEEELLQDPLIAPCLCKGSQKIVHFACFQQWINKKVTKSNTRKCIQLSWNNLKCEVCQSIPPRKFIVNKKEMELIGLQRPKNEAYIILESQDSQYKKDMNCQYLLKFKSGAIELGRSNNSGVKIVDVSVSRKHAKIMLRGEDFILEDNGSKFGTLIKLQDHFPIPDEEIEIQIGNSMFKLQSKEEYSQIKVMPNNFFQNNF